MILYVNPDRLLANDHMLVVYMYLPIIQTSNIKNMNRDDNHLCAIECFDYALYHTWILIR